MPRRLLSALLLGGAALADAAGDHRLALYALLAAVPALASAALAAFGDALDDPRPAQRLQAGLWGLALLAGVFGAAARTPLLREGIVPQRATFALAAAMVVLALEAVVALRIAAGSPGRAIATRDTGHFASSRRHGAL